MKTIAFWLSLALIFVIPWENAVVLPGLGAISRVLGVTVAMFWVVTVVVSGKVRQPTLFHFVILLFVLWNMFSIIWSLDVLRTVTRSITYLQLLFLVFMIWDLYCTRAKLNAALQAYVLGSYVSIYSMFKAYQTLGDSFARDLDVGGFNANDLAMILVMGMPIAWYLAMFESNNLKNRPFQIINFLYIPGAMWAVLLTASRGSFAAMLLAFLFMLGSFHRINLPLRILIITVLTVASISLLSFVPPQSFERLSGTTTQIQEGDLNGREIIWKESIDIFLEHPIIGVGSSAFAASNETGKVAHNFILSLLSELGLIGCGLFVFVLVIAAYHSLQQSKWSSRMWLTILTIWMMGALTHNWEYRKQTWMFLSFITTGAYLPQHVDDRSCTKSSLE